MVVKAFVAIEKLGAAIVTVNRIQQRS
ncbi:hypothetical protein A2U01_0004196, partial [Trifolium medium]|nr:hypothetical protein [Trifolium medium]